MLSVEYRNDNVKYANEDNVMRTRKMMMMYILNRGAAYVALIMSESQVG